MELSQLTYFYETAKLEHITKASEKLNIVQPALTKSIKSLERELGVKLFYKNGRCVKLTEYGVFLRDKLKPVLEEIDTIPLTISELSEVVENTITINVLAASTVVTNIIIGFKKLYPNVIFKMIQAEEEPNCNILITSKNSLTYTKPNAIKSDEIEEKVYIALPKNSPFAERCGVTLAELQYENFISLSGSRPFRSFCDKLCYSAGFTPHSNFESDSIVAVKNLVGAGVGLSFWPEFSWGKINSKEVKLIELEPTCKRIIEVSLLDNGTKSKIAEEFYNYAVTQLTKLKK